jgi:predicted lipoprotein with Yx(FWY)xxD motif
MWKKILLISLCLGAFLTSRLRQVETIMEPYEDLDPSLMRERDYMQPNDTLPYDEQQPANATIPEELEDLTPKKNYALNLLLSETFGEYISDHKNMSLYIFEKDKTGTNNTFNDFKVTCLDECEKIWPPYLLDQSNNQFLLPQGLNRTLLGSKLRDDGRFQYTYKHWPLYYYYKDKKPGDTLGQNEAGLWHLIDRLGNPIKSG